ncbi:hypothetical protein ABT282_07905 [Streptomyces sp. NPDC000927]|uniref:hypothetical protein n=1 Tax=Streptomyces sp. NPDC000927 TaxID=3154371 RepID=UPI00332412D6
MNTLITFAAMPGEFPEIEIPQNSFLGNVTSAGFGALVLISAYFSTRLEAKKLRTVAGGGLDKWTKGEFDWKSLLYWFLGAISLTAILGSGGGPMCESIVWIQRKIIGADFLGFLGDFAKIALCGFLVYMALIKKRPADQPKGDIAWGTICAVVMPIMSDIGAVGSVIVMIFMAMKNENDSRSDIYWGMGCAIVLPLGGGIWTELSFQIANLVSQIVTLGNT